MTPVLCRPSEARAMLARFRAGVEASRAICRRDVNMPERIRGLVERGFTVAQMARIVDRDQSTIRRHCRVLGLTPVRGKPGRPVGTVNNVPGHA